MHIGVPGKITLTHARHSSNLEMMRRALVLCLALFLAASPLQADELYAPVSPKKPWPHRVINTKRPQVPPPEPGWGRRALLWLPNRLLDLVDIVRLDAGVGPAYGGVVRITQWGQAGYRHMAPGSLRVGSFGRQPPFLVEREDERGIGPEYQSSSQRSICKGELGLGLDLFVLGGYAGLCLDAVPDFFAGMVTLDPDEDDLE